MSEDRASISGGRSYEEIGEYWDTHDAGDVVTGPVDFEIDLKAESGQPDEASRQRREYEVSR